jgi:predicted ATPase/DNA-binding SARP family transcriptional activator
MEFRILGPLEVAEGDLQVLVGGAKERALLAILLVHTDEVVSTDRLIEELWGSDLPANPSNALQVVVSRLRRALEVAPAPHRQGELLVTRKPGYVLDIDPEDLDARRFERLVEEAGLIAATDHLRASSLLGEGLGLWRGPALAEFAFEDFAQDEAARLEEARIRAVEMKMDADLALGRHDEVVGELKALVAGNPLRERLRAQLMLALYRSGRQGEALRVFQEGRKALVDDLGIDPGPELQELHQQILVQAASLAAVPETEAAPPRNNLPAQLTSFVGRDLELREVKRLLEESRLVTLTGAGGCGKTRLAMEVASELLENFRDGVWLVELEAVSDSAQVPQSLGSALGIREGVAPGVGGQAPQTVMDKLIGYLGGKEMLVVLDNCEHLIEACAQVTENVLRSAPGVRVLATSRERLGVGGEVLWPVPPLGLPKPEEVSPEQLARYDAVRLFVDRATAVQPTFVLDADAAPAVHQICHRLDGMPLALELAGARVRVLPPREIAVRLDDRFSLFVSGSRRALPRHQTLRAAIDWSYELLSEPERELFGQLSVFAGGFTLEAAEEVCGGGEVEKSEVLGLHSRLVEQSLVVPDDGGEARFRMLETLRRYAGERLVESGKAEALQRRHSAYFLRVAERAEPLLRGPKQRVWLRRLDTDHDNFSAAIDRALGHDPEVAVRLSGALAWFWLVGGHRSEARRRLDEALAAGRGRTPASRARALGWAATLGCFEGAYERAAAQAQEAHELSKQVDDPWWGAMSEGIMGMASGLQGNIRAGGELLDGAASAFSDLGDEWGAAFTTVILGYLSTFAGQYERAAALIEHGLDGFRAAGDQWGQTIALELSGWLARRRGAYEDALALREEALGVARDLGLRDEVPFVLVELGNLQVLLGDFETAAILHQEALVLARELGDRGNIAAYARDGLGLAARRQGHYEQAREHHLEAVSIHRARGDTALTAYSLTCLGFVEELRGDLDAAEAFDRESLQLARELPDPLALALVLEGLACVAAARQQPDRAAVLLGAAESIRQATGTPLPPEERVDVDRATDVVVSALGEEAFTKVLERGRRMSIEDAVGYALSDGTG